MVKAKKHLGQHFLLDEQVSADISALLDGGFAERVLEIGPGTGALTKHLLDREGIDLHVVEKDRESIAYLEKHYPQLSGRIHAEDFLKMDFLKLGSPMAIVGNFPYNISSQILFRVWDHADEVPQLVGMFQKEVAQRVATGPGSKSYGILSVLLQAFYTIEYHFTVPPEVFDPPPKVDSGVISLVRNDREALPVDKAFFKAVVKAAFNLRRKTLRNSLKALSAERPIPEEYSGRRPEQMSVEDFIALSVSLKA